MLFLSVTTFIIESVSLFNSTKTLLSTNVIKKQFEYKCNIKIMETGVCVQSGLK